jgi:hypothetical protein
MASSLTRSSRRRRRSYSGCNPSRMLGCVTAVAQITAPRDRIAMCRWRASGRACHATRMFIPVSACLENRCALRGAPWVRIPPPPLVHVRPHSRAAFLPARPFWPLAAQDRLPPPTSGAHWRAPGARRPGPYTVVDICGGFWSATRDARRTSSRNHPASCAKLTATPANSTPSEQTLGMTRRITRSGWRLRSVPRLRRSCTRCPRPLAPACAEPSARVGGSRRSRRAGFRRCRRLPGEPRGRGGRVA